MHINMTRAANGASRSVPFIFSLAHTFFRIRWEVHRRPCNNSSLRSWSERNKYQRPSFRLPLAIGFAVHLYSSGRGGRAPDKTVRFQSSLLCKTLLLILPPASNLLRDDDVFFFKYISGSLLKAHTPTPTRPRTHACIQIGTEINNLLQNVSRKGK